MLRALFFSNCLITVLNSMLCALCTAEGFSSQFVRFKLLKCPDTWTHGSLKICPNIFIIQMQQKIVAYMRTGIILEFYTFFFFFKGIDALSTVSLVHFVNPTRDISRFPVFSSACTYSIIWCRQWPCRKCSLIHYVAHYKGCKLDYFAPYIVSKLIFLIWPKWRLCVKYNIRALPQLYTSIKRSHAYIYGAAHFVENINIGSVCQASPQLPLVTMSRWRHYILHNMPINISAFILFPFAWFHFFISKCLSS